MGQIGLQLSDVDLATAAQSLHDEHARFLKDHRDVLVTFGPIRYSNGAPAGYAYQTDFPGTDADPIRAFLAHDPFSKAGLVRSTVVSGWRVALPHRQATMPPRPASRGFFFHGIGKPNITERRNTLSEAHRAHLGPKDNSNCLSRGGLTDREGKVWLGSAMVYEFPDRNALDELFKAEPFRTNGLYERIDIYDWQRGVMAS
jgi:uncharacterized protein YciI